jgi:hypothetical protein
MHACQENSEGFYDRPFQDKLIDFKGRFFYNKKGVVYRMGIESTSRFDSRR